MAIDAALRVAAHAGRHRPEAKAWHIPVTIIVMSSLDSWKRRPRRATPWMLSFHLLLLSFLLSFRTAEALWPFSPKRFKSNALISAGSLGLESLDGRIVAFGDFNGDQLMDVLCLGNDQRTATVYQWNHEQFSFQKWATVNLLGPASNLVPGDFNGDGRLDILVMGQTLNTKKDELGMYVFMSSQDISGFEPDPISVSSSTFAQPIPVDADGDMDIDLLGLAPTSGGRPALTLWHNVWDQTKSSSILFEQRSPPLDGNACQISNPHSNAFIDFDGDCLADLFLMCDSSNSATKIFQIWINKKGSGFKLGFEGTLPPGAGPLSFADVDRDGTIDIIFPTCSSISSSTGIGENCNINIAYNQQKPLCSSTTLKQTKCRPPDELCTADPNFHFDLTGANKEAFVTIPLSSIFPNGPTSLLLYDHTFSPPIPIPIRVGDLNLDGFPDLLPIVVSDISSGSRTRAMTPQLLISVPCDHCAHVPYRADQRWFKPLTNDAEPLTSITDARGVAVLDLDEDGTLDIIVQRTGAQAGSEGAKVTFIQNNFFHDAFFLKAIVLTGACEGLCTPTNKSLPRYHPFGVSYSGASYKYTILDTSGRRSAAQVPQLPQTSYHALLTPYSFFGLGRTNNYIENLFVGSTKHEDDHFINMEGVIPNSKVVIIPPKGQDGEWKRELYLRPGEWIHWVMFTVVAATVIMAVIVFVLHLNEKREDEMERRRALHHINFDAL